MASKYEVSKEIFNHILAMTKHEDEKAGRIILSIAFLSSASATVFGAFVKNNLTFMYYGFELISLFYFVSVLFVVLGSLSIMDAVGPNLNIPTIWKNRAQNDGEMEDNGDDDAQEYRPKSLYFFEKIAKEDRGEWCNFFAQIDDASLQTFAIEDHTYEAHLVSEKIQHKVQGIKTAKIFFIMSILFFVSFTFLGVIQYLLLHDC